MRVLDDGIGASLQQWLETQPVFFVATAPLAAEGFVNCSPKGNRGELVVLEPRKVMYLEQTGSGVETIAHLGENGRIVLMFCAFEGPPRIVRLHGHARAVTVYDREYDELVARLPTTPSLGSRSVIVTDVVRLSDSCGFGVPFMTFQEHRPTMEQWSQRKGPDGIRTYHVEKNRRSIDGLPGLDVPEKSS